MYQERFYRNYTTSQFILEVSYKESDLYISLDREIDKKIVEGFLKKYYDQIDCYTKTNPLFLNSLSPLEQDKAALPIIKDMIQVSQLTGIGPFSAVAGAIAHYVGKEILNYANEVIVENGGDLFIKTNEEKTIGVYLGEKSKLKSLAFKAKKRTSTFGIASSSSSIGPSLNLGRADLVTVIAKDAIVADGFATSLSNRIKKEEDLPKVIAFAKDNSFIEGLLIYFEGKIFLWGDLEISPAR